MNNKLIFLVLLLLPITIFSFFKKETNFINENNNSSNNQVKLTINDDSYDLNLEEYVIGVVAGEMPALFENEALKAQAVASRTYAINHLKTNESISTTISDQVYLTEEQMKEKWQDKYEEYYNKIKKAVNDTQGLIMLYNNEPIKAYYYSMSNGYTESSLNVFNEVRDYLKIVESPFDEDNSYTITISKETFCTNLNIDCTNITIANIVRDKSNRIAKITINNKEFTGVEVRKKLNLRSTDFTINQINNNIEITTKGYGHGVGMSQYGANNMAKQGYTYEEILKYYYQNIEINSI